MTHSAGGALPFEVPGEKRPRATTAVAQGVRKTVHALFPTDADEATLARKRRLAGTISQALSLAASIDRVSGAGADPRSQANGVPLSAMHAQLDALLLRLDPEESGPDPFDELTAEFRAEEERARLEAARAAAPDAST